MEATRNLTTDHTSPISRGFLCLCCGSRVAITATPAGESVYVCTSDRCLKTVAVDTAADSLKLA